jgi:hypothetical protein
MVNKPYLFEIQRIDNKNGTTVKSHAKQAPVRTPAYTPRASFVKVDRVGEATGPAVPQPQPSITAYTCSRRRRNRTRSHTPYVTRFVATHNY